jgi:hypothetical protein
MAAQLELPLAGGCGCGAVRFEVSAPLVSANYCHCTRFQRRSGTAASANARPERGSFRLVSGEESLRAWRPESGWGKWFCGECGSAVFSRHPDDSDRMSIRMGAFDADPGIRRAVRQFVAYAAAWEPLPDDGLPTSRSRRTRPAHRPSTQDTGRRQCAARRGTPRRRRAARRDRAPAPAIQARRETGLSADRETKARRSRERLGRTSRASPFDCSSRTSSPRRRQGGTVVSHGWDATVSHGRDRAVSDR